MKKIYQSAAEALDGVLKSNQINSILKRRKKIVAEWTETGLLTEVTAAADH